MVKQKKSNMILRILDVITGIYFIIVAGIAILGTLLYSVLTSLGIAGLLTGAFAVIAGALASLGMFAIVITLTLGFGDIVLARYFFSSDKKYSILLPEGLCAIVGKFVAVVQSIALSFGLVTIPLSLYILYRVFINKE